MGAPIDQTKDKDLAIAMLNDLKYTCECLSQKILETSNIQLKQNYISILNETFNEHQQLLSMIYDRSWLQPMIAQKQEFNQVFNKISTMQNEVMQHINMTSYQQPYHQPTMHLRKNQGHQLY